MDEARMPETVLEAAPVPPLAPGFAITPSADSPSLAAPFEGLDRTIGVFEDMCMNGQGRKFRLRLKDNLGQRAHTLFAKFVVS